MLSKQLKRLRKKYCLTIKQAAQSLGVPYWTYYGWERGKNGASLENIKKIMNKINPVKEEQRHDPVVSICVGLCCTILFALFFILLLTM